MNTKVTEQGILIPKHWLKHVDEVEIRKENGIILIIPIESQAEQTNKQTDTHPDPIFNLGQNPVEDELVDISTNPDKYIYK